MTTVIPRINEPEIFIGFVSPIGADVKSTIREFRDYFESVGYNVIEIKVTNVFRVLRNYISPSNPLVERPLFERYESYIAYGDQLRAHFDEDALFSITTIARIARLRARRSLRAEKNVFLIHQFKRKEEIDLLRSIYGRLFLQVSVYSRRGARVDHLSREFAKSADVAGPAKFRYKAEKLIQDDENESEEPHGQRVGSIFHDADFIVSLDSARTLRYQIYRFCELVFGSNKISPTHFEYGMFLAKAAALRTLDLSRQVGAAIFSNTGEIISLGSNEVPKALGGTYWSDGNFDYREYRRGVDSNDQRKREILSEILRIVGIEDVEKALNSKGLKDSQFMDALEYGRIVHAEMSAISDAARRGTSVSEGVLYSTTFPCHMCAKHIVAAGISRVVFLEPYPKSLAFDLHADALEIEGGDRGQFDRYPSVKFEHFYGVTPIRYRELFQRGKRKDQSGVFVEYQGGQRRPYIDLKVPVYLNLERNIFEKASSLLADLADQEFGD